MTPETPLTRAAPANRRSLGARLVFVNAVLTKVLGWLVIAGGLAFAGWSFVNGHVLQGVIVVFIAIPIALWASGLIGGLIGVIVIWPTSMLLRARRELTEFNSLQIALVETAGADRLRLLEVREMVRMYEQLPPPPQGTIRSPAELMMLAEELGTDLARIDEPAAEATDVADPEDV